VGSHAYFLELQGADRETADALGRGDLDAARVTGAERVLLELVRVLTLTPARTTDAEVQRCRDAGWTDPQVAEAVYVTAMFAFFNRVAEAFGLEDPGYREMGEEQVRTARS
jgi:alkylhydroperoxidase family enzyme